MKTFIYSILDKIAKSLPEVIFRKIDYDDRPEICGHYEITGLPTIKIFKDAKETGCIVGITTEDKIRKFIE